MSSPVATTTSSDFYPVLKLTEKNWVEYKMKTMMLLTARGLACHLDGTVSAPQPLLIDDKTDKVKIADKSHDVTATEIEANLALCDAFRQKEALVIHQIYTMIPNSVLIQVQHFDCLADIWLVIRAIYETKSNMMQVDI